MKNSIKLLVEIDYDLDEMVWYDEKSAKDYFINHIADLLMNLPNVDGTQIGEVE